MQSAIARVVKSVFDLDEQVVLTRPDEQFGDYATNVALQIAGKVGKPPREVAQQIVAALQQELGDDIAHVDVAGPGFINLTLSSDVLLQSAHKALQPVETRKEDEIITEFGDPNPFKEMHLGHLYTAIVGDSISHLLEQSGASVKRLSYHGDVGLHVARALWALRKAYQERGGQGEFDDVLGGSLGTYYADGAKAYADDPEAKEQIHQINEYIYRREPADDLLDRLYDWGKALSFASFDDIFKELHVNYVKRYFESDAARAGSAFVQDNIGKVFEESDGALVYRGEKAGLHTRVFITSRGVPTYEAKDLALAELKHRDFPGADQSIIITANEQTEYFKVMLAALAEIDPDLSAKTTHIAHGFLSLTTGKMSSRTGDVYSARSLMDSVKAEVSRAFPQSDVQHETYLAALKYTFLKARIGGDIVFDVKESVSLEGNSGPYIQYAHARARSILAKIAQSGEAADAELQPDERSLARKITEYPDVVQKAVDELMPHHVCTYLYELAQTFNRFYEKNRVLGDPRQAARVQLVALYADVLQDGLRLLNIPAPERL